MSSRTVTQADAEAIARRWLAAIDAALAVGDVDAVVAGFAPDGWWRDLLAVTWDLRTAHGHDRIRALLAAELRPGGLSGLRLDAERPVSVVAPDATTEWIEAFHHFETDVGRGRGVVRLVAHDQGWRAWTLLTVLQELTGHEEPSGPRRPRGADHGEHVRRDTWLERREAERTYAARDPQVIVVGAGQGGLTLAARLRQLGVDTLVVERNPRVGDNWRNRYRSLVLHDPVWYDHLPYVPFPASWPVFTPKDKLGDWFEAYASIMELNVWTGTELVSATYDGDDMRWTVALRRSDGDERALRPRHLVLATGASGEPRVPDYPGLETFGGTVGHSSAHRGGAGVSGRRAVVVGAGNSAHDIAQDLYEHGAQTVLVQRSGTSVMSAAKGLPVFFGGLYAEDGPPTEDADLLSVSFPFLLGGELAKATTRQIADLDRELLDGLAAAGFRVDFGEDGSGMFMKYLQRGGGYYLDVGCSTLIAEGKVAVKQGVAIERFTPTGLAFADGTELPADVVVFATGYEDMRSTARRLLGDAVADRCGPVWGLDEEGELRGVWRASGHPGLWFMGGNLAFARIFSRYLALRLAAIEAGLLPNRPATPARASTR